MKKLRFGKYEAHRFDKLNIGLFEVVPDGADVKRGKAEFRISDDGKRLQFTGRYYGTYGAAVRSLYERLLEEGVEDPDARSVADAIDAAHAAVREMAERIGAAAEAAE